MRSPVTMGGAKSAQITTSKRKLTPKSPPKKAASSVVSPKASPKLNAAIIDKAVKLAKSKAEAGMQVKFACVGRTGRDAVRRIPSFEMMTSYADRMGSLDFALASSVAQELDEVYLVYGEFVSMAQQPPRVIQLLPFEAPAAEAAEDADANKGPSCDYLYEPSEDKLLGTILPTYIKVQAYRGMLDTSASENAARMTAMDNATRNCNDLIKSLTLLYNKTRQASITSELIDIVGGAEALNG